jgi:hypothetical protein
VDKLAMPQTLRNDTVLQPGRAVITLATTKRLYVDMAFVLARSFVLWNREAGIPFHLFTDIEFDLPPELQRHVEVHRMPPGALGAGFSPKLHLDRIAPAYQTLFIDADCMVMGPVAPIFDRFAGRPVSVFGVHMSEGLWWGDVKAILKRIDRPWMVGFNGGLYYLEPGETAAMVYARAREIEGSYDAWDLVRLRGRPNDEVLMSIAMAEARLEPVHDDGTIMVPYYSYPVFRVLDVFAGRCTMENPPASNKLHRDDVPVRVVQPLIPHFVDTYTHHWRYRAEAARLRLHMAYGVPRWLARLISFVAVSIPGWIRMNGKEWLRPIYRALFGVRAVKVSDRI